jgi:hypothetical protein
METGISASASERPVPERLPQMNGSGHGAQERIVVARMGPVAGQALVGIAWRSPDHGRAWVPADIRRARRLCA